LDEFDTNADCDIDNKLANVSATLQLVPFTAK
jgi:hypothetical protein